MLEGRDFWMDYGAMSCKAWRSREKPYARTSVWCAGAFGFGPSGESPTGRRSRTLAWDMYMKKQRMDTANVLA